MLDQKKNDSTVTTNSLCFELVIEVQASCRDLTGSSRLISCRMCEYRDHRRILAPLSIPPNPSQASS